MIRNVIVDWSGTLVDDLHAVVIATNKILVDLGKSELTVDEFRKQFCLPFSSFYASVLPGIGMIEIDRLYRKFFAELRDEVQLLPGAYRFLEFCKNSERRLFLLSTIQSDYFQAQSVRLRIDGFFEHAYTQIFDKSAVISNILEQHALVRDQTVFIGDMVHDVEAAKQGGIISVAVLTGYDSAEKLCASEPDLVVKDLDSLRSVMEV